MNIIDFVTARQNASTVRTFSKAGALGNYMSNAGKAKIFPLYLAKQNPILRWMLIEIR